MGALKQSPKKPPSRVAFFFRKNSNQAFGAAALTSALAPSANWAKLSLNIFASFFACAS